jgi:excinuclease ABC subunit B
MPDFKLVSDFQPTGDQPQALDRLVEGLQKGYPHQTLRGATGTGKTFVMSCIIEQVQRPTLVISHNKTLAAQLCAEFREFFPENAVCYYVSFYDYYQPEAYLPHTDTYIEKDATINEEIDRLRHAATQAVSSRRDVIIVASVSCIYGIGAPDQYRQITLDLRRGATMDRAVIIHRLIDMQFLRNNVSLERGRFRVRGDVVEICPADGESVVRVDLFGDEIDRIVLLNPLTGEIHDEVDSLTIFPASHYVTSEERLGQAMEGIRQELEERLTYFRDHNLLLEAQRLEQRTRYDLEMIREVGTCQGIENYSMHLDGRQSGQPAFTLLDYFPQDFLMFIDESHQTIPQIRGMWAGDRSRKDALVNHGFRLPSAYDNRPLFFDEFEQRIKQVIYTSATPGPYELAHSAQVVEQIIRPTGLVDPEVEVRPVKGQIDDLIAEIKQRTEKKQRVLVTTLTKRMAEDLTEYLGNLKIRVQYLHSEVETLDRVERLRDLRLGEYDVLVGINLLREGLDLPEVSLVAILDADREGFLRSEVSLIQTMGRAARNVEGKVIMYADQITDSMKRAIDETNRRRQIQKDYNEKHGIIPQTIQKAVRDSIRPEALPEAPKREPKPIAPEKLGLVELEVLIAALEKDMKAAAAALNFERAAQLRDEIAELRRQLPGN